MECRAYSQEFETLTPPVVLGPWLVDCLSVRGANTLRAPLTVPPGSQEVPTLRGDYPDDSRTGIFFPPKEVGITLEGWEGYRFTCQGLAFQAGNYQVILGTETLTGDRVVLLPDGSGTLMLRGEATSNPESTTAMYKTVAVADFPVLLLAANPTRIAFSVTNNMSAALGGAGVFIGFSNAMVAGDAASPYGGTHLSPGGGSFALEYVRYTGEVWGMATSGGASVVGVMEFNP